MPCVNEINPFQAFYKAQLRGIPENIINDILQIPSKQRYIHLRTLAERSGDYRAYVVLQVLVNMNILDVHYIANTVLLPTVLYYLSCTCDCEIYDEITQTFVLCNSCGGLGIRTNQGTLIDWNNFSAHPDISVNQVIVFTFNDDQDEQDDHDEYDDQDEQSEQDEQDEQDEHDEQE